MFFFLNEFWPFDIWITRALSTGIYGNSKLDLICHILPVLTKLGIIWFFEEKEICFILLCPWSDVVVYRWVHTCNVTAYRNNVTLQVTDTIRSYDLNFHSVPHDVTVSCERYTVGFRVCYGSQKHHECKEGERSGRWWRVTLHVQTCSGRNRIIFLIRRPNTDNVQHMPVTLPRNQFWYVTWSWVSLTMSRYGITVRGNVTVCTNFNP
jgi:hypothetical protein